MRLYVLGLLFPSVGILAQEATGEGLPDWANYGILGLLIVGLVFSRALVPGNTHREIVAKLELQLVEAKTETKEARAEIKTLTTQMLETQAPALQALQAATQVMDQAIPLIRTVVTSKGGEGST